MGMLVTDVGLTRAVEQWNANPSNKQVTKTTMRRGHTQLCAKRQKAAKRKREGDTEPEAPH